MGSQVDEEDEETDDVFMVKLRRSIKTVEVAGHILKNRFGSLEKEEQRDILEIAMSVYLRITNFLLSELQRNESDFIEQITYLIAKKVERIQQERTTKNDELPTKEKLQEIASQIFFEFNFMVCYSTVMRTSYALGSKELLDILKEVCDQKNTPLTMLVKRQALAMYKNALNPSEIKKECISISPFVKRLLVTIVLEHFHMHKVQYSDRQKITAVLGIDEKRLLVDIIKNQGKN